MRKPIVIAALAAAAVLALAFESLRPPPLPWSNPRTWSGRLPAAGDTVVVARGQRVLLDRSTPRLKSLVIDGTLTVADRDIRIEAQSIVVHGTFRAGAPRHPFAHHLEIVLDVPADAVSSLTASEGGHIELFGLPRVSWTALAQTANAGSTSLALRDAVDWKNGDRIVIAPTSYDYREAEERTIRAAAPTGVELDKPLRYRHWGTITDGVDERAEVGLLSHSIVVRTGDGAPAGRGGQVVVLAGATLQASNVEFDRLGELGVKGRYPVHFHLAGNGSTSFVSSSSIAHSNNRCIAVHGTSGVTLSQNVAFDTIGHCYFLEDGIETGITLDRNLAVLTRAAQPDKAILDSDVLPASYWITNPANTVTGNVAAGSAGNGFWYDLSPHPTGPSATADVWPRRTPLGEFARNAAHSNEFNGLFVDILRNPPGVREAPNYDPPQAATFETFLSYKNRRRGAWLRGTNLHLTQSVIADNSIGVTFAGANDDLTASLLVGQTDNETGPAKPFDPAFPIRGFEFYDGQVSVSGSTFVNFVSNAQRRASALSALQFSPFFTDPTNFAQSLTFHNAEHVYFGTHMGARDRLGADGYRSTVFRDVDGSVTGTPDAAVVFNTPLLADDDCDLQNAWNALVCKADYASLFILARGSGAASPGPVRVALRSRFAYLTLYGNPERGQDVYFQTNVRADRDYTVTFPKGFPAQVRVGVHHLPAGKTIRLFFPQAGRAHSPLLLDDGAKATIAS